MIGTSDWVTVDQARIDAFAAVTEDWQFIHTDPAGAATDPFGGTVAHGVLTLSLLSRMAETALPWLALTRECVNHGFDRVRFLAPVRSGARMRGVFTLSGVEAGPMGPRRCGWGSSWESRGRQGPRWWPIGGSC